MGKKQKMSFYIPVELHSRLRKVAFRRGRTMTQILIDGVRAELERLSPQKKVPQ